MLTPYQKIAKQALINWNGLSEEKALNKVTSEDVDTLESQVNAINSITYAIATLSDIFSLDYVDILKLTNAIIYGPVNDQIFDKIKNKIKEINDYQKLSILSGIHDGWVMENCDKKTFDKKISRNLLRQYAPLELIGWNEVKNNIVFLSPILSSLGINIDIGSLENVYHDSVSDYFEKNDINSIADLFNLISLGNMYYPVINDELDSLLSDKYDIVTKQILLNWDDFDPKSAKILYERQLKNKKL